MSNHEDPPPYVDDYRPDQPGDRAKVRQKLFAILGTLEKVMEQLNDTFNDTMHSYRTARKLLEENERT